MHEPWNVRDWAVWLADRVLRRTTRTCRCCGKPIWGTPTDFSKEIPWDVVGVGDEEFDSRVYQTEDYCIVDDRTYFVRGVIELPIIGRRGQFRWGVWCDISADSFKRFLEHHESRSRDPGPPYFGWLCAELPGYEQPTLQLKTLVHPHRRRKSRPVIEIEPGSHALADEQRRGITVDRWHELVRVSLGEDHN